VEQSARERSIRAAGEVLVAAGMCEAMTRSVVSEAFEATASPWTASPARRVSPALVRGADRLRRTLLPSLLEAAGHNRSVGAPHGDLFEVARVYLDREGNASEGSPLIEPLLVSLVNGGEYSRAKGLAEAVIGRLGGSVVFRRGAFDLFTPGRAAEILIERAGASPARVGVVGEVSDGVLSRYGLEGPVSAAELRLDLLEISGSQPRKLVPPSEFPAVQRDLNLVVDQGLAWAELERAIRGAPGADSTLESLSLGQVWEDAERLGVGKKSLVVGLRFRSRTGTISSDESKRLVDAIIASCGQACGAVLRG
jgi:phenylalanyl-tRNA synthetase beta chain